MPDAALVFGHPPDLRESLRTCLLREPCHAPINDWRHGEVTPERRARLRRFFPDEPIPAAVLVPFVERREGATILLTQRAAHLKTHAGQISFPGGRIEPQDEGPVEAALRETEEEIGLARTHVEVLGFLPDHLVISGYRVTPVVGILQPDLPLRLDATEVEGVFEVPLAHVLDANNHVRRVREFEGERIEFTDFPYGPHNIWGATAGMLMTLYRSMRGELS
ncbi:MAG: CoA pyrophosphatase [Steroidobacteraceae bacterium]|jgi:8-oxo-dGTP pyrophosphatase MutT (NUDIX family)|nr:CoA pyrophosphatase [Gammaproteobacteria bacterium]NDB16984.1 CoA pyrophosphatase [Gammaproteobacteria bacterium]NDE87848.1 CoA pyrophosphatase [Gammaproteobacteria bacterium]